MKRLIVTFVGITEKIPLSLLLLFARIIVGLIFFQSGLTKIDGFSMKPSTFFLFADEYKVPLLPPVVAAYLAATTELTMPLLLWSGLGTRFAALALLGMTAVIQTFVYPDAYVTHGLWAIALLLILKHGAGALSLDYLLRIRHESTDVHLAAHPQ